MRYNIRWVEQYSARPLELQVTVGLMDTFDPPYEFYGDTDEHR